MSFSMYTADGDARIGRVVSRVWAQFQITPVSKMEEHVLAIVRDVPVAGSEWTDGEVLDAIWGYYHDQVKQSAPYEPMDADLLASLLTDLTTDAMRAEWYSVRA